MPQPSTTKNLCCMHPQPRTDSPEPPSRPLASIDGIFAAAVLPRDHPHALEWRAKKPELDQGIVASPGLVEKVKCQFRRRSVGSLGGEGGYDCDARVIGSEEVLGFGEGGGERVGSGVSVVVVGDTAGAGGEGDARGSDAGGEVRSRCTSGAASKTEVRSSVLGSAEYLVPLIGKPPSIGPSVTTSAVDDVAIRVATLRALEDVDAENEKPLPQLPKSLSSPLLFPWHESPTPVGPRRARSEFGLGVGFGEGGEVLKMRRRVRSEGLGAMLVLKGDGDLFGREREGGGEVGFVGVGDGYVGERDDCSALAHSGEEAATEKQGQSSDANNSPRLHTMAISQQLRSMSQLSDPHREEQITPSPYPWNFHHRERPDAGFDSSKNSRQARQKSSTGLDSTAVPSCWGRVRSPTAASSIYSRPTSAGASAPGDSSHGGDVPPYTVPNDLDALFADWPLKPAPASSSIAAEDGSGAAGDAGKWKSVKERTPTPTAGFRGDDPFATVVRNRLSTAAARLSATPSGHDMSKTSSSSIVSASSKKSRFLERFTPPKRLVRKRRSMFKFLRPGSRKQQTRSVSTPVLSVKSPSRGHDGPSEDPSLLTVQYELADHPQHSMRSASMSQLGAARQSVSAGQAPSGFSLHRSPTHADYERNLSAMGDDRRRPSTMNLTRLQEIQEEERKESTGIMKKLSRAKELKDDVSPLMAQALSKHQREKDLFRSSSKRREAERAQRPTPVFSAPSFGHTSSSLAPTPEDHSELLDPLEKGELGGALQGRHSAGLLSPLTAAGPSRRRSTTSSLAVPSTAASSHRLGAAHGAATGDSRPARIGTSLASWSRYPTHTRVERCGSAGLQDNVRTRDFALDFDPEDIQATDETEAEGSPASNVDKPQGKRGKKLPKSRSLTFSGIARYYSNIFHTSGFAGQNRRTSVTTGGRLEHPELEMLAPQVPSEQTHSHGHIQHLKDIVKEDADKIKEYVREEEDKLEDYVRKEEQQFEKFVHDEEDKIGEFVREEEDKFEGFVRKEEGKWKKFVHEEEDKWKHRHSEHRSAGSGTPFRHGSIFAAPHEHAHSAARKDTMVAPNNDQETDDVETRHLRLDGAAEEPSNLPPPCPPSKAELWSTLYRDCLARPPSTGTKDQRAESMPPPTLQPIKARSPEQRGKKQWDADATVRRFPSVTVVDDRKGHLRSVSLISVKTGRSTGLERPSMNDLLELIREREREEREKLVGGGV